MRVRVSKVRMLRLNICKCGTCMCLHARVIWVCVGGVVCAGIDACHDEFMICGKLGGALEFNKVPQNKMLYTQV